MRVREASTADATRIAALLSELGYPADGASIPGRLERLLAGGAAAFVAEEGARAVGLATVHLLSAIHEDTPVAMLTALVVTAEVRRLGTGRSLVERCEAWAREQGAVRIVVATGLTRSGAQAFYESLGYAHKARHYSKPLVN